MGTKITQHRGHLIVVSDGEWFFADSGDRFADHRPCGHCGRPDTEKGHDGCIADLPGPVWNACCGHGEAAMAYVQLDGGRCIRGEEALGYMFDAVGRKLWSREES